ncbi:hypothetical protein ABIE62_001166 [Porphyrobacter sp. MBR-155]|jgi:hypothetical protein|uniref:hypothetical protein n=1 Tax=Porphyrobacter sp. MBR-155 TaxID=3156464 RepID=UPI00339B3601
MEWSTIPPAEYHGLFSTDVAVRVLGRAPDGRWDLQLNVKAPATDDGHVVSSKQLESIHNVFPHIPGTITHDQGHALISYCEFARILIAGKFSHFCQNDKQLWASIFATLVSHDEEVGKEVVAWLDDRRSYGSERYPIEGVSFFDELIEAGCQIENGMQN